MLVASAILKNNKIYTGLRHYMILNTNSCLGVDLRGGIQGFVDNNNKFYNRVEAKAYALKIGQITSTISDVLTSEDLW